MRVLLVAIVTMTLCTSVRADENGADETRREIDGFNYRCEAAVTKEDQTLEGTLLVTSEGMPMQFQAYFRPKKRPIDLAFMTGDFGDFPKADHNLTWSAAWYEQKIHLIRPKNLLSFGKGTINIGISRRKNKIRKNVFLSISNSPLASAGLISFAARYPGSVGTTASFKFPLGALSGLSDEPNLLYWKLDRAPAKSLGHYPRGILNGHFEMEQISRLKIAFASLRERLLEKAAERKNSCTELPLYSEYRR